MQQASIKELLQNKAPVDDPEHFKNRFQEINEEIHFQEKKVSAKDTMTDASFPDLNLELRKKFESVKQEFHKYYEDFSDVDARAHKAAGEVKKGLTQSWNTLLASVDKAKQEFQKK